MYPVLQTELIPLFFQFFPQRPLAEDIQLPLRKFLCHCNKCGKQ